MKRGLLILTGLVFGFTLPLSGACGLGNAILGRCPKNAPEEVESPPELATLEVGEGSGGTAEFLADQQQLHADLSREEVSIQYTGADGVRYRAVYTVASID